MTGAALVVVVVGTDLVAAPGTSLLARAFSNIELTNARRDELMAVAPRLLLSVTASGCFTGAGGGDAVDALFDAKAVYGDIP